MTKPRTLPLLFLLKKQQRASLSCPFFFACWRGGFLLVSVLQCSSTIFSLGSAILPPSLWLSAAALPLCHSSGSSSVRVARFLPFIFKSEDDSRATTTRTTVPTRGRKKAESSQIRWPLLLSSEVELILGEDATSRLFAVVYAGWIPTLE